MIDLGNPFRKPFQDLVDSMVQSLQLGVEQAGAVDIVFQEGKVSYDLSALGPVDRVADTIVGISLRQAARFHLGIHYLFTSGQLSWNPRPTGSDPAAQWFPDTGSRITLDYFYRDIPSGLTDFNQGSVSGTIVRTVAREFTLLHEQMNLAYQRAFIDYAQGAALDNVVAILGISRNQAVAAQGAVSFWLKQAPKTDLAIQGGVRVSDSRGRLFKVIAPGVLKANADREETVQVSGGLGKVSERIGKLTKVALVGGAPLVTTPVAAGKEFGDDERTIALVDTSVSSMMVSYQPKSLTVSVIALEDGPGSNLGPGSISVMPTPPRGVTGGVENRSALTGGQDPESDDQLRDRARHELERTGNATLNALRYAVMAVDGIQSVDVRDWSVDEAIPLGEVRIMYASDSIDPDVMSSLYSQVAAKVEATRSAGIRARISAIEPVTLSVVFLVAPDTVGFGDAPMESFATLLRESFGSLGIGEPVSARKLSSLAYRVPGLADVLGSRLSFQRLPGSSAVAAGAPPSGTVDSDPFPVEVGERIRVDADGIGVLVARGLALTEPTFSVAGKSIGAKIGFVDGKGNAITPPATELQVALVLKAKPSATPTQALAQVWRGTGTVAFDGTLPAAGLTISDVVVPDVGDLNLAELEMVVQASAYPGVQSTSARFGA